MASAPSSNARYEVHGTAEAGFEPVRERFERLYRHGREDCSQLCVYLGDKRVVDLWGFKKEANKAWEIKVLFVSFLPAAVRPSGHRVIAVVVAVVVVGGLLFIPPCWRGVTPHSEIIMGDEPLVFLNHPVGEGGHTPF